MPSKCASLGNVGGFDEFVEVIFVDVFLDVDVMFNVVSQLCLEQWLNGSGSANGANNLQKYSSKSSVTPNICC